MRCISQKWTSYRLQTTFWRKIMKTNVFFPQRTERFMLYRHWEASIFWQTKQRNTAERARGFKRDAILLLNFNISCAGETEWAHLPPPKKPSSITGNEVVCLNHAIEGWRVTATGGGISWVQSGNQREQPFPVLQSPL